MKRRTSLSAQFFSQQAEQNIERLGFCLKCNEIDQVRNQVREAVIRNDSKTILEIAQKLSTSGMMDSRYFSALTNNNEALVVRGVKLSPVLLAAAAIEIELMRRKSERYAALNETKRAIVAQNDPELMHEFLNELLEEKIIDAEQYEKLLNKLTSDGVKAVADDLNEIFYQTQQVLGRKIEIAEAQVSSSKGDQAGKGGAANYRGSFVASYFSDLHINKSPQGDYFTFTFGANPDISVADQKRAKRQLFELCEILKDYGKAKQTEHKQSAKREEELDEESERREKLRVEYVLAHSGHPYAGTFQTYLAKLENFSLDYLRLLARAA